MKIKNTSPANTTASGPVLNREATIALTSLIVVVGFAASVAFHYVYSMYQCQRINGGNRPISITSLNAGVAHMEGDAAKAMQGTPETRNYSSIMIGKQFPFDTFLFSPDDMFNDFNNGYKAVLHPNWYRDNWPFMCNRPPWAYCLTLPFTVFPPSAALVVFLMFTAAAFLLICRVFLYGNDQFSSWRNAAIFAFLTYPFLFALDRGNDEVFLFLLLALFIYLFQKERYWLSIIPLSMVIAAKPFPGVFLILLLIRGCVRQSIVVVLLAIGLTGFAIVLLMSLFSYDPKVLFVTFNDYNSLYVIGDGGLAFGNSLWGALKVFLFMFNRGKVTPEEFYGSIVTGAMLPYRICVVLAFFGICVYLWRIERTLWKQVALLVFAMNLFPPVSADYKLMHLFLPFFLFVNRDKFERLDVWYAVLFGLSMIPMNYLRCPGPGNGDVNIGVVIHPALMLALGLLIIISGLVASSRAAGTSRAVPIPAGR